MNSLSVLDNINLCEKNINQLNLQKNEIEKEIFRVEGMLRTFQNLKQLGVETIPVKLENKVDFQIENTEVVDDAVSN